MRDPQPKQSDAAVDDDIAQTAVLHHMLELHPAPVAYEDLICELTFGRRSFTDRDRIERAVRDLIAVGLLHRDGALVTASRAAVRAQQLNQ